MDGCMGWMDVGEGGGEVKNDGIACVSHMLEGGARCALRYFVCGTEC
jgi:hypothetical protein